MTLEQVAAPGDFAPSFVINALENSAVLTMRDLVIEHLEPSVFKAVYQFGLAASSLLVVVKRVKHLARAVTKIM
jgi:hypothetical protein